MSDETEARSFGATEGGGHRAGGGGECSPLQARASFLGNWDWKSVVGINERACSRGGTQHGINSETGASCAAKWSKIHKQQITLLETISFLRLCHRRAPFLFYNGNTFSFIGRELAIALFSDLPPIRKRELGSAIAHHIAGVLDEESMVSGVEALWRCASLQPGDMVRTLKGSLHGVILEILEDGRVKWRSENGTVFIALPESLVWKVIPDNKRLAPLTN